MNDTAVVVTWNTGDFQILEKDFGRKVNVKRKLYEIIVSLVTYVA